MARVQRETGARLARAVDCGRGGLAVLRVLERDVAADDRRGRTLALTDAGRAVAARHAAAAHDLAARIFADWPDEEVEAAAAQFRKVADAVVRHQRLLGPEIVTPAHPGSPEREIA